MGRFVFITGAFFIPYLLFLVCGGIPVLFLEVAVGQYFRNGGITVWQLMCPFFKGIGYGTLTVAFILNCYYIVIISWALLYLYHSFTWVLPWSTCDNEWNTIKCWSPKTNKTAIGHDSVNSVVEFWERKIIQVCYGPLTDANRLVIIDIVIRLTPIVSGLVILDYSLYIAINWETLSQK